MNELWEKVEAVKPDKLTSQQREIAQLIAESHSTKAIARQVKLSVKTIGYHYRQIENRLGLDGFNVALITRWAVRHHLTHVETWPEPGIRGTLRT